MSQAAVSQRERRISRRRAAKGSTRVTCHKGSLGLGPNLAVSVLDLSETGVRMLVKTILEKGQDVEITLLGQHNSRPVKLMANVAWCVAAADGTYCIGAHFPRGLSYAILMELTAQR